MEKPETQETNQMAPMELDQDTLQEAFEVALKVLLSTWPTLIMAVRFCLIPSEMAQKKLISQRETKKILEKFF